MGEQSFARMLAILQGRWKLVVALALPVVLLSVWFAATRPPAYTSEVVVGLNPEPSQYADNSFLRLMPRYLLTATSDPAVRAAETAAGLPAGSLASSVSAENPSDTTEVFLTVTTESPEATPRAVQAIADVVVAAAADDPLVSAAVLAGPSEPADGTPIRQMLLVAVGLTVATALAVSLAFLVEGARPRLRVREDVAALGIPAATTNSFVKPSGRWSARPARTDRALTALRSQLESAAGTASSAGLVVTSPSLREAAVVATVVDAMSHSNGAPELTPELRAHPGVLVDDAARATVTAERQCLLVLAAGTPTEEAQDCVRLLERLRVRVVAAVLAG
jgi:capsular polysaccharide biosynthesis protein